MRWDPSVLLRVFVSWMRHRPQETKRLFVSPWLLTQPLPSNDQKRVFLKKKVGKRLIPWRASAVSGKYSVSCIILANTSAILAQFLIESATAERLVTS